MSSLTQEKTVDDLECTAQPAVQSEPFYSWYVVVTMMLFYVLSFMDRQIIAVLIEPIKADLQLTDVQISLVGGISFVLFYSILGIFMGRLADSSNRPLLIGVGVFLWSLTTAFCGMASKFWHLLILRMGVGLGESALMPSTLSLISDYFPKERLATATSVFLLGAPIGIGVAYAGGGYLYSLALEMTQSAALAHIPILKDRSAWQLVLLFLGVLGIVMTLLLITIREPRNSGKASSQETNVSSKKEVASIANVKNYFRANWKAIGGLYIGMSMVSLASYAQGFWDITFLIRTYDWDPVEGGFFYGAIQLIGGIVGLVGGGYLVDLLTQKGVKGANFIVILLGTTIALVFGIAYPLMPTANLSLPLMLICLLGNNIPFGCAAAAVQRIFPGDMRGLAAGIYFFMLNAIGLGIGPTAVALMTDYVFGDAESLRYSLAIIVGLSRVSALILIFIALDAFREMMTRVEAQQTEKSRSAT